MVDEIITGDAFLLARDIGDDSVGLILCDPVYWEPDQYALVASLAQRCLVPGRSAIAQAGNELSLAAEMAMQGQGLIPAPVIMEQMTGGIKQLWNTRSLVACKPYLRVIRSGGDVFGWMPTLIRGWGRAKEMHAWEDTSAVFAEAILRLTAPGDIVLDPFTGSGTVPAMCKRLGRRYIAFEIDAAVADVARRRAREVEARPELPTMEQLSWTGQTGSA